MMMPLRGALGPLGVGRGGGITYLLYDQFTTDLPAGSVNGTSAEPIGGTRTVTDTNSKLSITGSQLSFASSGTLGEPRISYSIQTRTSGKTLIYKMNKTGGTYSSAGFSTSPSSTVSDVGMYFNGSNFQIRDTSGNNQTVGTIATATDYTIAVVLRSTGAYYYIKGGTYTNWTLLYISALNSANLYPAITGWDLVFTADNIRIPTSTWLPEPLAFDDGS